MLMSSNARTSTHTYFSAFRFCIAWVPSL